MRQPTLAILTSLALSLASVPAEAQNLPEMAVAKDLLLPCQEADNDPRDGFIAELECLSYIRGFVAAIELSGEAELCFPEANRDDEIRRAYVRWVHGSFSKHGKMPVGAALLTMSVLGREDMLFSSRVTAVTGTAMGLYNTGLAERLFSLIS